MKTASVTFWPPLQGESQLSKAMCPRVATHLRVRPFSPTSVRSPASQSDRSRSSAQLLNTGGSTVDGQQKVLARLRGCTIAYLPYTSLRRSFRQTQYFPGPHNQTSSVTEGMQTTLMVSFRTHVSCAARAMPCSRGSLHHESGPSAL